MGGQALIEVADLLAQILLLQLQQGLWILPLDAADENVEKRFEQIADTSEHGFPLSVTCRHCATLVAETGPQTAID